MNIKNDLTDKEMILKHLSPEKEIPFSNEEYETRLRNVRRKMAEEGIDILYLTAPESLFYMCGYKAEWYMAQSPDEFGAVGGMAIHVDRDDCILFDTEEEEILYRFTTVAKDIRAFREIADNNRMITWIVKELKESGWLPGKIALEVGNYRPNRRNSEKLQKKFENEGCQVVDGTHIVRNIRFIKSSQEIAYVREAAKIAEIGINAAINSIRAGITELEVYAEIVNAIAKAGGENPAIPVLVASGVKTASLHALASRKKIEKGELVNVDVCGVFNRYHVNLARTFSVGNPDPDVARVVGLSAGSFDVIRDSIRPNMPVKELTQNLREYYEKVGIFQNRWWFGGYELGIAFPPDWVGTFVFDLDKEPGDQLFVPGTVVNYESNVYLPKKAGVSIQINTLLFEKDRAEILSNISSDLIVID